VESAKRQTAARSSISVTPRAKPHAKPGPRPQSGVSVPEGRPSGRDGRHGWIQLPCRIYVPYVFLFGFGVTAITPVWKARQFPRSRWRLAAECFSSPKARAEHYRKVIAEEAFETG
jgi:hypothetical protein